MIFIHWLSFKTELQNWVTRLSHFYQPGPDSNHNTAAYGDFAKVVMPI